MLPRPGPAERPCTHLRRLSRRTISRGLSSIHRRAAPSQPHALTCPRACCCLWRSGGVKHYPAECLAPGLHTAGLKEAAALAMRPVSASQLAPGLPMQAESRPGCVPPILLREHPETEASCAPLLSYPSTAAAACTRTTEASPAPPLVSHSCSSIRITRAAPCRPRGSATSAAQQRRGGA